MKTAKNNIQIEGARLAGFLASWPCHGIPSNAARLEFWFDAAGDLVDVNACDATGDWVDVETDDMSALAALAADAKAMLTRSAPSKRKVA